VLFLSAAISLFAQNAALRGVVTDETGGVVPAAVVTLTGSGGFEKMAAADSGGLYTFPSVPPGEYTLQASAPQLTQRQPQSVTLRGGTQIVNLRLMVASTVQQIVVEENAGPAVSLEAANNASAVVLRGDDLDALSDNPEDMQSDLEALAGPSAGPGGGRDHHRWIQLGRNSSQRVHSRDSHQPEPLFAGVRQTRPGPDRDPHQAGRG